VLSKGDGKKSLDALPSPWLLLPGARYLELGRLDKRGIRHHTELVH
jgi:hypothetical protein